jgi:hypothetical protein
MGSFYKPEDEPHLEAYFPFLKARPNLIKDKVLSLLPDQPSRNDEYFHENLVGELGFGLIHHSVEVSCKVTMDVEGTPTRLIEGTIEKRWKVVSSQCL